MRFTFDGPSIPDELLIARDEGRVVFFCGAGVSFEKAKLPDFLSLTKQVISELGVDDDEPANKLLNADAKIKKDSGISVLSLDRVFGLLENDYNEDVIEAAVAKALKPTENPNLQAHQILLKLAKTPAGNTQLVTTNFDRLFEKCDEKLDVVIPPKLPKLSDGDELNGIIHLHGIVTEDYKASEGDRFVLSSSEFGHAYLANGWATEFIKSILEKYVVVFVGYTAEDPPLRYLLEALNKRTKSLRTMYAFHENTNDDAQSAWASKGVTPIKHNGYPSLWDSLELWAERARDPEAWKQSILTKAINGPASIKDFERAQVAHIVSTVEGMQLLANMPEALSSEWLCVFDPDIRLKKTMKDIWDEESEPINFFERYGLDSDTYKLADPDNNSYKDEIPSDVWSCLTLTPRDKEDILSKSHGVILGWSALSASALSRRLAFFGDWIAKVADQPITVWWAVKKGGLHSDIIQTILNRCNRENNYKIATIWQELSKIWIQTRHSFDDDSYYLEDLLNNCEWSIKSIKQLINYYRPSLQVDLNWVNITPPMNDSDEDLNKLFKYEIKYKSFLEAKVPDKYLVLFIKKFRHLLEEVVELEQTYTWSSSIDPLYDASSEENGLHHDETLSYYVDYFAKLMKRLIQNNKVQAKKEYLSWNLSDTVVFARLGIWISGECDIFSGDESGQILLDLPDETFWDGHAQRDLLLTLKKRWSDYSVPTRQAIEKRLLAGQPKYEDESEEKYLKHNAYQILSRIHWLDENECSFEFDLEIEHSKLLKLAPNWKDEYAKKADGSMQGRGGIVHTDSSFDILLKTPLKLVLEKSTEVMFNRDEFLREFDPFDGLSSEKPLRAFSALTVVSKQNNYPEWAWNKFLYSQSRKDDLPKFIALIAARIIKIPLKDLEVILRSLVSWYQKIAKQLMACSPQLFGELWSKIILVMTKNPKICISGVKTNSKHNEWVTYAIKSPQGYLAEILMDIAPNDLEQNKPFPLDWICRVEELLHMPEKVYQFPLIIFSSRLAWFFWNDPAWTTKNLLSFLDQSEDDKYALFAGLFRSNKMPSIELYKVLKPYLLELAKDTNGKHDFTKRLSGILLVGWRTVNPDSNEQLISDLEIKYILKHGREEFLLNTLEHLIRWIQEPDNDWDDKAIEFIHNIWPQHKKAKTEKVSGSLCSLALSNAKLFPKLIEEIVPLIKGSYLSNRPLQNIQYKAKKIADKHPEKILALLFLILSEDTSTWPYNINNILDIIVQNDSELLYDKRFIELRRRWNSRYGMPPIN